MIGKLFYDILAYSFLLLPLFYLIGKGKKDLIPIVLMIYGTLFFFLLYFYFDIPKNYRLLQQVFYTTYEYLTFAIIILLNTKKNKRIIVTSSFAFILFQVFYLLSGSKQSIDSVPIGIETILIFTFALLYFVEFFNSEKNEPLGPPFYLTVAILLYLGPNLFFNLLANQLSVEQANKYWHFTYIPEIIKNIIFAVSILFINSKNKIKNQEIAMPPGFLD